MAERRSGLPRIIYPPTLPIVECRAQIVTAIRDNPVVIITGETGSGKTTQIPKMCLEAGRGLTGRIGCTQPRRIAATTVARRIAEELGEELGRSVGYKIRFDEKSSPGSLIKVMTDGILLMEAHHDPLLRAYDTIIVDEAHERSLNIDFILGILKTILPRRRDLRVVITSATIDTQKFSKAFGDAPIIEVSGRLFPVEVRYRPLDSKQEERGELTSSEAAVRVIDELIERRERGDILIFMPTEQDIRETCEMLAGRFREEAAILPLFSRLTAAQQQRVFQTTSARKIVVATNVAETSITIPGIRYVIDTGLARIAQYNPRSRTAGLPVRVVSKSSADQRKGRCGRVQNGICIRLYSEEDYLGRPLYTPPEILRSNLAGVILRMLALNLGDIDAFPFIDRPTAKSIRDGVEILQELGAIEAEVKDERGPTHPWRLTERGRVMARLPLDPRISRMILEARKECCLADVAIIAAALAIQDPRERPTEKEAQADQAHALFKDPSSDFSALLNIWRRCHDRGESPKTENALRRFCKDHFLSYRRIREWRDIHNQILRILAEQKLLPKGTTGQRPGDELYGAIHRSILSGFLGHIALKKEKNLYTATQGRQAMIFPGSGLFNRGGNWIVAAEMVETSRLFARTVANIDSAWLEELGGSLCRRTYFAPHWEKDRGEVVASEQVTLFGLTIINGRSVSFGRIDPDAASRIFIRSALIDGEVKRPLPFLMHNEDLIERILSLEEKVRRHDLLIGEDRMAEFYEKRLSGIYDIRTLQKLIRDKGGDQFLRMREEDILVKDPDREEIALYPSTVSTGGWKLDCLYRFEPGKPLDGVTLKIPVQAIPSLPADTLDWAVPGLLREKVAALLKGLPKEYRKRLQPLNHTCEVILQEMVQEGPLPTALGRFIYKRYGIDIPANLWSLEGIEEHLKLRLAVVDGKDRELAAGRDIGVLRQEFVEEKESRAFSQARQRWEKSGITAWDFVNLPVRTSLTGSGLHAAFAFPGLDADENGVALRLFRNEPEARNAHRRGLKALFAIHFREELRYLRKGVAPVGNLKLWAAAFGGVKALENACIEKVMDDLFTGDIRTQVAFEDHAQRARPQILPRGQAVVMMAGAPLKALYEATEQLRILEAANRGNRAILTFLGGLREELVRLLPVDFLIRYDQERLGHIGRYLRALTIRAERGAINLEKAIERGKEIEELTGWHDQMLRDLPPYTSGEKRRALEEFTWMIEEYKVSLFAQELKTAFPVSRKRIEAKMGEIQRML
jgi:ATP-dependent helicase HrpA